ncbi:uncharacterized protein LOC142645375 isoform X1 [Dermatophagoides pteronyssinus]|uniref:uncharacterized protein LOC142645375 isoform X1 n=1 Tax=Dermatophagoides pteronyssinus TaxID=6956 RepID=UPI003F66176C
MSNLTMMMKNFLIRKYSSIQQQFSATITVLSPLLLFRMMEYLQRYLKMYNDFRECKRLNDHDEGTIYQKTSIKIHPNCQICLATNFIETLLFIQFIKFIYFYFFSTNDPLWIKINADCIGIFNLEPMINLFAAMLIIQIGSFNHNLFYKNFPSSKMYVILFEKNGYLQFHPPYFYRNKLANLITKNIVEKILKTFSFFIIMIHLAYLTIELITIRFVYNHFEKLPANNNETYDFIIQYFKIFMMIINWKIFQFFAYIYLHSNLLMATCFLANLFIFYIKTWQTERLLINQSIYSIKFDDIYYNSEPLSFIVCKRLIRFKQYQTDNLRMIDYCRIYSDAFTIFLFIHMPINCYLIIFILSGKSEMRSGFFLFMVIIQQFIVLIGFHIVLVSCNRNFQHPSIRYIERFVQLIKYGYKNFPTLLKLSNYGQTFHTRNKYGFTYGKLELITMKEFVGFALVYSQLLMFIYEYFIQNQRFTNEN